MGIDLSWVGRFHSSWKQSGDFAAAEGPLKNLFKMFEYAYDLRSFKLLPGLYECESIRDFYEQLALILAKRFFLKPGTRRSL